MGYVHGRQFVERWLIIEWEIGIVVVGRAEFGVHHVIGLVSGMR